MIFLCMKNGDRLNLPKKLAFCHRARTLNIPQTVSPYTINARNSNTLNEYSDIIIIITHKKTQHTHKHAIFVQSSNKLRVRVTKLLARPSID